MNRTWLAFIVVMALLLPACVTFLGRAPIYDRQTVTIQTFSLFNQREKNRFTKKSWRGDWILRRHRLRLIDGELRRSKPDILVLQQVMSRDDNSAESDQAILSAGSLSRYGWKSIPVEEYGDTLESESLAVVAGVAVKFPELPAKPLREFWVMGRDGYLMATTVQFGRQPVDVFNVRMPPQVGNQQLWFRFVADRVRERLAAYGHCHRRVIVAGYMPGDPDSGRFAEMIEDLGLRETAAGYCEIASRCYTASPTNSIFMATEGDETPTRTDRIFVHQSALVYTSTRNFVTSDPNERYAKEFGLTALWPSKRFGWISSLKLASCRDDELPEVADDALETSSDN